MKTLDIGSTSKGSRIWLQALEAQGWPAGTTYVVNYGSDTIWLVRDVDSKRRVTAGKGGIIDITSQRITRWSQGSRTITVDYSHAVITIQRGIHYHA